jgi:succinate dehydrogenase / fumarate reductase, membrane anchor subunit
MIERDHLQSPLSRAVGRGSAKEGVEHWWAQKLTSVALVPLALWFVASVVALAGADRDAVVQWLHGPLAAILMVLLLIAVFYHLMLGIQVIVEDYVHSEWAKIPALVVNRLACYALGIAGVFAVLRIAFGG